MQQHFVTFLSPGTFLCEETCLPINSWDVPTAVEMATGVSERYGATPFAFYFTTRERGPDDLDSKESAKSPRYYLGGEIRTLEQVQTDDKPDEKILVSNMEGNGWGRIITNRNSWRITQPLNDGDIVLDYTPPARKGAAHE